MKTKLWRFLRTYILTVPRFDLFLQGALLILILLDHNVYILLKRDADAGYHPQLVQDWVFLGASGAEFVFGVFIAWTGRKQRHLALSCWLALTAASALLVLAFPFSGEVYRDVGTCGNDVTQYPDTDPNIIPRTILLIITAICCCLTKISIWSHGLTYLDDHEPQNGPYFYGILISIRLSLGLSGQTWLIPGGYRDDWWEAHLSLAMLTLMFAVLFTLFPKQMPNYEPPDLKEDDGFLPSVYRVLCNKAVLLQIGALAFLNIGLFCFVDYNQAFIQARFHLETLRADPRTPTLATSIFRPMVIIFFIMIFRIRFSVRRLDGVKANTAARVGGVVALFAAVCLGVLAVLDCGVQDVRGTGDVYTQPGCSQRCGCNSELYGFAPVCDMDTSTTYFSPCHAGCSISEEYGGLTFFSNCTCVQTAYRGACSVMSCQGTYGIYQAIFTITLAIAGSSFLMQDMVLLRAVHHHDKAVSVGVGFAIIALLSHVLGHLLYMFISDQTCLYKHDGACLLHQPSIRWMPIISAIMAVLSAIVSLIASRVAYSVDELH
ncbi:solute carrier organic anion transporter family member 74D isoform X2 [Amyelois transitella]|uniref:solute carrier organic anion transporter family member 74D isoform X2 n=1 Tax=Amyelois transitella TaxID=680683 RepID=UPI0029904223|nr:solute carrier organic anion transporter family member 74D isoform X2 [Amyelois transitella]